MLAKAKLPQESERSKRKSVKRKIRTVFLFLIFFSFLGGVVYFIFFSSGLDVKTIEVNGNESISSAEVVEMVKNELLRRGWFYNLLGAENIIFWRDRTINEFDTKIFPRISSIKIEVDLFAKGVRIDVVERNKFIVWCEGSCFWLDDNGILFTEAPEAQGPLIKTLRVVSPRGIQVGDSPLSYEDMEVFKKIVDFLDKLEISVGELEINDFSLKEVAAQTIGGPDIYFSLIYDPSFGEPVVKSLKNNGDWERIEYLDLRVDGRAYYKLK